MQGMRSVRRAFGVALFVGVSAGCSDSDPAASDEESGGSAGVGGAGGAATGGAAAGGTGGVASGGTSAGGGAGTGGTAGSTGGSAGAGGTAGSTGGSAGTAGRPSTDYEPPASIIGGACEGTPTSTSMPCAFGAEQEYCRSSDPTQLIMATCSVAGRTQCEAVEECEAGWHACTATDYVARGGRDVAPNFSTTNRAWLAACARDLGDVGLKNEPCGSCDLIIDFEPVVEWWCDGSVVYAGGMSGDTLGVHTSPECMRVGENDAAHGAFWTMGFTGSGASFVMCCLDD
jgi:hypothetical protein